MINRLEDLVDPTNDSLGLQLDEDRLPQRIRSIQIKRETEED
jgi:hypothetical protein